MGWCPGRCPSGSLSHVALRQCHARPEHVDRGLYSLCRRRNRHRFTPPERCATDRFDLRIIEATTPILGWIAGVSASRFVQTVEHWIACALLAGAGIHMLYATIWGSTVSQPKRRSLVALVATAVGTSIDAMASLAFLQVNIVVVVAAVGLANFVMSTGCMHIERLIGHRLDRLAEIIGGFALCGLGAMILLEHLPPM